MIISSKSLKHNAPLESVLERGLDIQDKLSVELILEDLDPSLTQLELEAVKSLLFTVGSLTNSLCHIDPNKLSENIPLIAKNIDSIDDLYIRKLYNCVVEEFGDSLSFEDYLKQNFGQKSVFLNSLNRATETFRFELHRYLNSIDLYCALPDSSYSGKCIYFKENELAVGYVSHLSGNYINTIMNNSNFPCSSNSELKPFTDLQLNWLLTFQGLFTLAENRDLLGEKGLLSFVGSCHKFCRDELMQSTMHCSYLASKNFI